MPSLASRFAARRRLASIGARTGLGLALLLAAPLLAGCFVSGALLADEDQAIHPLADGVYARAGGGDRFRLTLEPDGWYAIERLSPDGLIGETHRVLVTPEGGDLLLTEARDDGYAYAAARLHGDDLYLAAPDCADPFDRGLAADQNASGDEDEPGLCRFADRVGLDAAMQAFLGSADFGAPFHKQGPAAR